LSKALTTVFEARWCAKKLHRAIESLLVEHKEVLLAHDENRRKASLHAGLVELRDRFRELR
jgi:hypothetical protein